MGLELSKHIAQQHSLHNSTLPGLHPRRLRQYVTPRGDTQPRRLSNKERKLASKQQRKAGRRQESDAEGLPASEVGGSSSSSAVAMDVWVELAAALLQPENDSSPTAGAAATGAAPAAAEGAGRAVERRMGRLLLAVHIVAALLQASSNSARNQKLLPLLLQLCSCGSLLPTPGPGSVLSGSSGSGGVGGDAAVDGWGLAHRSLEVSGPATSLLIQALEPTGSAAVWLSQGCRSAAAAPAGSSTGAAAASGFDPDVAVAAAVRQLKKLGGR